MHFKIMINCHEQFMHMLFTYAIFMLFAYAIVVNNNYMHMLFSLEV